MATTREARETEWKIKKILSLFFFFYFRIVEKSNLNGLDCILKYLYLNLLFTCCCFFSSSSRCWMNMRCLHTIFPKVCILINTQCTQYVWLRKENFVDQNMDTDMNEKWWKKRESKKKKIRIKSWVEEKSIFTTHCFIL